MIPRVAGFAEHGGRLCEARALYPDAPEPWIDLSTGINPQPYPAPRASDAARGRLPTLAEIRALEAAATREFGMGDGVGTGGGNRIGNDDVTSNRDDVTSSNGAADRIVATAGSEEALRLLPYILQPQVAIVVGPTYSSHAAAWRSAGVRVSELNGSATPRVPGFEDVLPLRAAVTLVNPNNPDGAITEREHLRRLHESLTARQGCLVVDEAFADADPECSVAAVAGSDEWKKLIVLRSFGKFYGLAGIRLGFVIGATPIVQRFRELLGDWRVSADAIAAGVAAYPDHAWTERERRRLRDSAHRLDAILKSSGFEIAGGTSLFRLARHNDAPARFGKLLRAGILTRPFRHDPALLRFGLPGDPSAWNRLAEALRTP